MSLEARDLCARAGGAFEHAALRGRVSEARILLLGHAILLRFASAPLAARLMPALSHLVMSARPAATSFEQPDLTIDVWDGFVAGAAPHAELGVAGERYHFEDDGLEVFLDAGARLTVLDRAARRGYLWVDSVTRMPPHESAAPLRRLFHGWSRWRGLQLVHAAAVGRARGGVLFVGRGGSGKSSSALACLNDPELGHASDDYCLVEPGKPPRVHCLFSTAKLRPDSVAALGALAGTRWEGSGDATQKAIYFLNEGQRSRVIPRFGLSAIVMPRVTGGPEVTLTRASAAEALRALAPSTIVELRSGGREAFANLSALVREVPVYRMDVGSDRQAIARAVRGLIDA